MEHEATIQMPTDVPVVAMAGEIDLTTVENFRTLIREAEAAGGDLVIDLRETTFIDSTGISALIGAAHHAEARNGKVTVIAIQPLMRRVFAMMQLDGVLHFEPPLTNADAPGHDGA